MNAKEISELRRRFRADRSNISRVCGCFVNEQKEIISEFDQSLGMMGEDDAEHILKTRKKLNDILAENTGRPVEEIARDKERDNYMSADEAQAYGLIDGVITKR